MELKQKEMFTKDNNQFIIVVTTEHNGKTYAFANKLLNDEEVTDEYNVFTIENNEIEYVNDHDLINQLLPTFQELIKNELEIFMKDNNE